MVPKSKPRAKAFCDAFVASYSKLRSSFAAKKRWDEMWPRWGDLMLSRPEETSRLPREITASVLTDVAAQFGLCYPSESPNRQPMTLDAIFSAPTGNDDRFPIRVAIEHELSWRGVDSEIKKLLYVRCPLKVGITYTADSAKGERYREEIADWIREDFEEINLVVGEDPATEYLFLVGAESDNQEISRWHSLSFPASDGPGRKIFQPVDPIVQKKGAA